MNGFESKEEHGCLESEVSEDEITAPCSLNHTASFLFTSESPGYGSVKRRWGFCLMVIFQGVLVTGMQTGRDTVWKVGNSCICALLLGLMLCLGCCELSGASRHLSKSRLFESSP